MVPKRPFHCVDEGESGASAQDPKRFKNVIRDVLGMHSMQDMAAKMEPFLRLVVRDEVERTVSRVLQPYFRSSFNLAETSRGRSFLLQFVNKPPSTIFTGSKIEDEDGNPIRIELVDANSKTLVTSGSLSSMKIEILVLDGDFVSDDQEDWSENEFNASIIREREGRRPLLTGGDLNVTLRGGCVLISDVLFTDNSSWQRSRKFRLGARPVSKTCSDRIREASSEAFIVKDHRGELYKKHYPPQLDDDVWRLERIAKEGTYHRKLVELGIHTVRDFLRFHSINPSYLRKVLGGGVSNKIWDTIIDHANTCVLDDKFYTYYEAGQSVGLLFNSVYKVIGVTFDGQIYEHLDKLVPPRKIMVETLKRQAYKNVNEFIQIDARAIPGLPRPLTYPPTESFDGQNLSLRQLEFPVGQQNPPEMLLNFNTFESGNQLEVSLAQNHPMEVFPEMLQNSFKFRDIISLPCSGESSRSTSASVWPVVATSQGTSEEISQAQTSAWEQGNALIFSSGNEGEAGIFSSRPSFGVHISRIGKPKAGWCKLRAAINLGSVRRSIAAKRMWQSFFV